MRYCILLLLLLFPFTAALAEPYAVWEDAGAIWARDEATAIAWAVWDDPQYPAHSPFAHGRLAVWVMDWSYAQDLMGHQFGGGRPYFSVHVTPELVSNPQCYWTGDPAPDIRAFAAWRQEGGLWGLPLYGWEAEQLVADYSGAYSLDGEVVTWDGGSANLREMAAVQDAVPEPSTLLMLAIGLVVCLGYHYQFPGSTHI